MPSNGGRIQFVKSGGQLNLQITFGQDDYVKCVDGRLERVNTPHVAINHSLELRGSSALPLRSELLRKIGLFHPYQFYQ